MANETDVIQKFIYAFDETTRDRLLELKYKLLKGNDDKKIYVFINKDHENFALKNIERYALSDVLTF
jgi:hypothetical protein